jgi:hypothetical protein
LPPPLTVNTSTTVVGRVVDDEDEDGDGDEDGNEDDGDERNEGLWRDDVKEIVERMRMRRMARLGRNDLIVTIGR